MKVVVTSRLWFEDMVRFPIYETDMVISISSPNFSIPRLHDPKMFGVPRLNLHFQDVTRVIESAGRIFEPMSEAQAKQIVDFAEEYHPWCRRLVVHCDAGASRSPGVAIGLARFFPFSDENTLRDLFPRFNVTVASLIWAECRARGLVELTQQTNGGAQDRQRRIEK